MKTNILGGAKVLIWDLDGTLYEPIPQMIEDRLDSAYKVIRQHTGWSREKAKTEFEKIYLKKTPSVTKTSSIISNISLKQAAYENELYKDRGKYLKRDPQLIGFFLRLKKYTHYMLVNGIIVKTIEALNILGIFPKIFKEIVTSEIVGENKPSEKGYRYILQKTGLPAETHLMIGDRDVVDLLTAKKLGMKTCLVWSKVKSKIADLTLPSVYKLADYLL